MAQDPSEEHDPIKRNPLHDMLRSYVDDDMQVSTDSSDFLTKQLTKVIDLVGREAVKNARERDVKTVEKQDIRVALNEIFYPYTLLEEVATTMGEYELELRKTASQSPVLDLVDENE